MTAGTQGQQGAGRRCLSHQKDRTTLCDRHPDHPGRADWAAAVPLDDIATLTRLEPTGSRTWVPAPELEDAE
ncbi:DUF6211 family protein [Streptomyces sp. NPDC051662]|uniref:DUF6211 family protein n=1 Tax=Streptomyces sp. NPDC051662 TaxID=3154750 RepID=UPI00343C487E